VAALKQASIEPDPVTRLADGEIEVLVEGTRHPETR